MALKSIFRPPATDIDNLSTTFNNVPPVFEYMANRVLDVTIKMMPETWDRLEESKPDDLEMDTYIRDVLRAEVRDPES
ncbi:hypothetical protein [Halosimplex sp. J119]